ncbi:unnamed protein product [Coffea canephora]|uniref:AAA+ ATPase domain-containing protein n=1 Tax=Coffea canephora TaxID=49390 RepID=A0A068V9I7_COFCA|nr:unnamed protein product [Coffea canephora]
MFDRGLKAIWAWLVIDSISNIGIYGMGGVGKTTFAKHIHNHLLERTQFKVYWITVSQEFSIRRLQDDIAKRLRLDLSYEDDEDGRAAILSRELVKQSVLILDDVWQEFSFEKIGIPLGANKCRVILTTRSLELCNRISCQRVFEAKTLAIDEAWDLFKHTLDTKTVLHEDVEEIAKSIMKRCAGLPLGIITVAGSLRGGNDICEWRNALEQLEKCSVGHDEMERDVFPILEWSFNRLNECQMNCFLYCPLYPEDCKIKRKELIDLFIWAKLMDKQNSRSRLEAFDQGHTILNKLIKVCLLEETTDLEEDDCVKMHDLVRDMALRITNGNSKLKMSRDVPRFLVKSLGRRDSKVTLEQKIWAEDLHAVSFHTLYHHTKIKVPPVWSPNCPKLSTLLIPHFSIKRIPDSFIRHMRGLKVLNLNGCIGITELPNSISNMVNLAALILGHCEELRSVPPLGMLKQLRELDLSRTKIQDLPQGLESLVKLERLNLDHCRSFTRKIIPKGTFSKLHRLQRLVLPPYEYYYLYINDDFSSFHDYIPLVDDIGYRKRLYFHQCKFGKGSNYPVLLLPSDMKCLELKGCVGMGIRCLSDIFKNFTSLKDLSSLKISAYLLPPGTFSSLRRLSIYKCHNVKQLFTVQLLRNFESLRVFSVDDCKGLAEVAANDNGIEQGGGEGIQLTSSEATSTVILPNLMLLDLNRLPQLKNICKATMICDSIEEIVIFDCPKLKRLPLFLPTINRLPAVPSTLHKIRGDKEGWESLEWDNPCIKNALDPFFTTQRWSC